jgi:hypothetical protein
MRRRFLLGVSLALIGGMLILPGIASADHVDHQGLTWTRTLTATLTGDGEVPPVETDAAGLARITLDRRKHLLCYELIITGIEPVAGHIHRSAPGTNGGPVVDLDTFGEPFGPTSAGCTVVDDAALLRDMVQHPRRYYVNLHTTAYPGGEIRGQLAER